MLVQGKLLDEGSNPTSWDPNEKLAALDPNHVRYSKGYLRCKINLWLEEFPKAWNPLLHSLGAEAELISVVPQFIFPETLSRIVPIEIDGEAAVIGMDDSSQKVISDAVAKDSEGVSADVIVEYFERRLLSCLNQHWKASIPVKSHYVAETEPNEVEVVCTVNCKLSLSGSEFSIWFGLGSRAVDYLDKLWREKVAEVKTSEYPKIAKKQSCNITFDLAELAVAPSLLIDYMRSGTVIDLEVPVDSDVKLSVDGSPFAKCKMAKHEGNFAFEISELNIKPPAPAESTTNVSIQLAEEELKPQRILELAQEGAIHTSNSDLSNRVSLIISGERVASAILGTINGNFALTVLPK